MALNDKQKRFCEEYLIDLNATQAAIRAGYSDETSRQIGSENLSKLDIQEYLAQLKTKKSKELNISFEDVVLGVYHIAQNAEKDADKLKAYDQVSKHLGFYEKDNNQKKTEVILPTKIEFTKGAGKSKT